MITQINHIMQRDLGFDDASNPSNIPRRYLIETQQRGLAYNFYTVSVITCVALAVFCGLAAVPSGFLLFTNLPASLLCISVISYRANYQTNTS